MKTRRRLARAVLYPVVAVLSAISFIPFFVLFQITFSTPAEMTAQGIWHVPSFTLENIITAWNKSGLGQALLNSTIITCSGVVLTVVISCAASYIIARFKNRFTSIAYNVFVFSMAIPAIISTVPLYLTMRALGAINSLWGIVALCVTTSLPFAIFLYTGFIRSTPRDMEEAGIIDGCSNFSVLWRILFPVLKPVTLTVVLLNTVYYWNEYGRSVFFLQKRQLYTVPLAISTFIQQYSTQWGPMAGGAFVALLPAVVVFLAFQKYYVKGISSGAVKG